MATDIQIVLLLTSWMPYKVLTYQRTKNAIKYISPIGLDFKSNSNSSKLAVIFASYYNDHQFTKMKKMHLQFSQDSAGM